MTELASSVAHAFEIFSKSYSFPLYKKFKSFMVRWTDDCYQSWLDLGKPGDYL